MSLEDDMTSHSLATAKHLQKELQNLEQSKDTDDDICSFPDTDNILQWTALICGPKDTPYEDGAFQLLICCGTNCPLAPPNIIFQTKVFHPYVHFCTGNICLDILKKEWSPTWGLLAACWAMLALLSHPNANLPLNCDAGNMMQNGDPLAYHTTAKMYTIENAAFLTWPHGKQKDENNNNNSSSSGCSSSKAASLKTEATKSASNKNTEATPPTVLTTSPT